MRRNILWITAAIVALGAVWIFTSGFVIGLAINRFPTAGLLWKRDEMPLFYKAMLAPARMTTLISKLYVVEIRMINGNENAFMCHLTMLRRTSVILDVESTFSQMDEFRLGENVYNIDCELREELADLILSGKKVKTETYYWQDLYQRIAVITSSKNSIKIEIGYESIKANTGFAASDCWGDTKYIFDTRLLNGLLKTYKVIK